MAVDALDQNLPVAVELEDALIGWAISCKSEEELLELCDLLDPEDFYNSTNATIYAAIKDIVSNGKKPDIATLHGLLETSRISATVLIDKMNTTEIFGLHRARNAAAVILDKAIRRDAIRIFDQSNKDARDKSIPASTVIENAEQRLLSLTDDLENDRANDVKSIMEETNASIEENLKRGRLGYKTGFKKLDSALGGLVPSHIWTIGAYTGTGKTFFTVQLALNVLKQGGKVAMFSTEMDRESTYLRLLGNISRMSALKLMSGLLTPDEQERKEQAEAILLNYQGQLRIYDNAYTTEAIRLKCKRQKLETGLDLFTLDFVQNLTGKGGLYERMSEAAVQLQKLCKDVNVCGVIMSQVSNDGATSNSEVLQYKGAGELAAIADAGLWLNKTDTDGKLQLLVRKSRHGISGLETYLDIDFQRGGVMREGMAVEQMRADLL